MSKMRANSMASVTDKVTTSDIVAKVHCHRSVVLRNAAKLGIVPEPFWGRMLFTKAEAERLIKVLSARRGQKV